MKYRVFKEANPIAPYPLFIYVVCLVDVASGMITDRLESYDCMDRADTICRRLNLTMRANLRQS